MIQAWPCILGSILEIPQRVASTGTTNSTTGKPFTYLILSLTVLRTASSQEVHMFKTTWGAPLATSHTTPDEQREEGDGEKNMDKA